MGGTQGALRRLWDQRAGQVTRPCFVFLLLMGKSWGVLSCKMFRSRGGPYRGGTRRGLERGDPGGAHTVPRGDARAAGEVRREVGLQHGWGAGRRAVESTWS